MKKTDPKIEEARRLLAGIEGDLRKSTRELKKAQTDGVDHFRTTLDHMHQGLDDSNLDVFAAQAKGLAAAHRR
jgi:hypothetical protein